MTAGSRDEDVTDSGGTIRRLREPPSDAVPDLAVLESLRRTAYDDPLRPAGSPPYLEAGQTFTWHYGMSADAMRVVRDDERGLVAWLPPASEQLASVPSDGRDIRDRPMDERFTAPRHFVVRRWQGPGILRIAPTGVPWSIWYFTDDDGRFEGHYLNLELVHRRPARASRLHTRDLILDLWVERGETWLKDADELEAVVAVGTYTPEQADAVRAIAEQARRDQVDPRAWPMDERWEEWQPPPGWDEPLTLPDDVLEAVVRAGEPVAGRINTMGS